jgi:hypothetical protein
MPLFGHGEATGSCGAGTAAQACCAIVRQGVVRPGGGAALGRSPAGGLSLAGGLAGWWSGGLGEQGTRRAQAKAGPDSNPNRGCSPRGRPCCTGLQDAALDAATRRSADRDDDRSSLSSRTCLAAHGRTGLQLPASGAPGGGTRRASHPPLEARAVARDKKKRGGRTA